MFAWMLKHSFFYRANRRNRNKRPHAENLKSREDVQKMEEQARIVEELNTPRPLSEELKSSEEESLKQANSQGGRQVLLQFKYGEASFSRNKNRLNRRHRRLAD